MNEVSVSLKNSGGFKLIIFTTVLLLSLKVFLLSFHYFDISKKLDYFASSTQFISLKILIYSAPLIILFLICLVSQIITNRILPQEKLDSE